jgi:hypothetical protein
MDISSIALQGIAQAETQANAATANLANAGAGSSSGADLDVADLSTRILALTSAETLLWINLSTLKTADQIQQGVVDLIA